MHAADLREHLLREGISRRVVDVLMSVPRDRFVPPGMAFRAWEDHAMAIGHGQTISQPTVVALMTEAAAVGPGDHVLDVGTGSGYQAAVLAACGARVHSIERLAALSDRARVTLAELGYDVDVRCGDGTAGLARRGAVRCDRGGGGDPDGAPGAGRSAARPRRWSPGWAPGHPRSASRRPGSGARSWWCSSVCAEGISRRKLLDVVFVPLVWEATGSAG